MNQPIYWVVLVTITVLALAVRMATGAPLLRRRARPLGRADVPLLVVSLLALTFHCAAMFFAPWTDALPGGLAAGRAIRAMGSVSQWAYWLPAAALLLSLRRLWWPGPLLLGGTLVGVGVTMFWPFPLSTHLAWLAAALICWVAVAASLVELPPRRRTARRPVHLPAG